MHIIFLVTLMGSLLLLTLSIWPGTLSDILLQPLLGWILMPIVLGWCCLIAYLTIYYLVYTKKLSSGSLQRTWSVITGSIVLATYICVQFELPRKMVFAIYYKEFELLLPLATKQAAWMCGGHPLNKHLGPYLIKEIVADKNGGVYFLTHEGHDGIGPDTMSYGFVFLPNSMRSPYGSARYIYRHLFEDWYSFEVSDDY